MNNISGTNLFIGDQWAIMSEQMKTNNIKHVLNVTPVFLPIKEDINYKQVPWEDVPTQDIFADLKDSFKFLDDTNGEPVLINCQAGRSRSATMLIAYMMKKYKLSYEETLEKVRKDRQRIDPNPGFKRQLQKLEELISKNKN